MEVRKTMDTLMGLIENEWPDACERCVDSERRSEFVQRRKRKRRQQRQQQLAAIAREAEARLMEARALKQHNEKLQKQEAEKAAAAAAAAVALKEAQAEEKEREEKEEMPAPYPEMSRGGLLLPSFLLVERARRSTLLDEAQPSGGDAKSEANPSDAAAQEAEGKEGEEGGTGAGGARTLFEPAQNRPTRVRTQPALSRRRNSLESILSGIRMVPCPCCCCC